MKGEEDEDFNPEMVIKKVINENTAVWPKQMFKAKTNLTNKCQLVIINKVASDMKLW